MGKYKMIAFTDPISGREDEFNDWYDNHHLQDIVSTEGFPSAQRFKLHTVVSGEVKNQYIAIYEIDAPDPETALKALIEHSRTSGSPVSDAMDRTKNATAIYEACSEVVSGTKAGA
jgi:hypothetical protein